MSNLASASTFAHQAKQSTIVTVVTELVRRMCEDWHYTLMHLISNVVIPTFRKQHCFAPALNTVGSTLK